MLERSITRLSLELTRQERMRLFRKLWASQWWPQDRILGWKDARLQAVLRHATASVPFYQEVAARLGLDPAAVTADDLTRMPLVDKTIMASRIDDFRSRAVPAERFRPNNTGGSTGAWFNFFSDPRADQMRAANDMRSRMWAGWKMGERQALLWGHRGDVEKQGHWLNRLRNEINNRVLTLNAYDLDEARMERFTAQLVKYRPTLMVGYASALAMFAEYLRRRSQQISSLRGCLSMAETLLPEQREIIEAVFRCPVLDHYGSREFGTISQQCRPDSPQHITIERVWVEIVDETGALVRPGERGEIVITDFDNYAMPFIRYRTGDLGIMGREPCACGRGLPVLHSVEGRVSEIIVGRNGKMYSCQSPRLFGAEIPGIRQMQVVQECLEEIVVRIVPDGEWSEASAAMLRQRMSSLLGDVRVTIDLIDYIPKSASGKYRFTISKVSPFLGRSTQS